MCECENGPVTLPRRRESGGRGRRAVASARLVCNSTRGRRVGENLVLKFTSLFFIELFETVRTLHRAIQVHGLEKKRAQNLAPAPTGKDDVATTRHAGSFFPLHFVFQSLSERLSKARLRRCRALCHQNKRVVLFFWICVHCRFEVEARDE